MKFGYLNKNVFYGYAPKCHCRPSNDLKLTRNSVNIHKKYVEKFGDHKFCTF